MKKKVLISFIVLASLFNLFSGLVLAAGEEEVSLDFMHFYSKSDTDSYPIVFNEIMDEFIENHPEYDIKQNVTAHDNYQMKIKTLAAANEMPDIFVVKGTMIDNFRESGLIEPLDDILANDQEWKNSFVEGAFDDVSREEGVFGIPVKVEATSIMFYNQAIFKEAGVDEFPETWEEFKVAIQKIKDAGYTPISLGNRGKWVVESCLLSMLGDRYTGTDWFRSIRYHQGASFTDPEFVEALTALQELAEMGAFNRDMNSIDNIEQRRAYYNGEAAMFFEGAWAFNPVAENAPEEVVQNTRLEILPEVKEGKGKANTVAGGAPWAFQINPNLEGEEKEAAVEILKALSSQKLATKFVEKNGAPPVKPGNYDESKLTDIMKQYNNILDRAAFSPVYDAQLSASVVEVMNSGLQELLIGVVSPEELAERIQDEHEKN
ncbi:MAG: extracellular solute-binding protein [Halothermotrichaceae bacterium]